MDAWLERFARANFIRSGETAHDLKTPLNVAVLNLELLRMRVRKVAGEEDEKILLYTHSIETELRRMARIFDAFFILSTPPKEEGEPALVNVAELCGALAEKAARPFAYAGGTALALGHESRLRQALQLFFEGTGKILGPVARCTASADGGGFAVETSGTPQADGFEVSKVFKFYYSDGEGNPDLSLATARLIAETYGGRLDASEDRDKVIFSMAFPPGEE